MHKKPIMHNGESKVDSILSRHLSKEGFRILPKIRVQDAIEKDKWLPPREFEYYTRSHFDFLVTKDNNPIFAVEFDGEHHFIDDRRVENDIIKNRLCKEANLPLLRITSSEVDEHDKVTLLDYMLMRYVAWKKEYPKIIEKIKRIASTLPSNYDPEDYAIDFDPSVHFDLMYPFPARETVVERLWEKHRIARSTARPERHRAAKYLCDVTLGMERPSENDQFLECTSRVQVWRPTDPKCTPVFSKEVSVSLRAWLPLQAEVPAPDVFRLFWDTNQDVAEVLNQFKIRVESMWFPKLPGINIWDIAENYTEYLGLRMVERWAKSA